MVEHFTEALVLSRSSRGDQDSVVHLYTQRLGRLNAFVKSGRKITSKLTPHLEPGTYAMVRLIQPDASGGRFQVADALRQGRVSSAEGIRFFEFVRSVTPELDRDLRLWHTLQVLSQRKQFPQIAYRFILSLLGFGADEAQCARCGRSRVDYFVGDEVVFLCRSCSHSVRSLRDDVFAV